MDLPILDERDLRRMTGRCQECGSAEHMDCLAPRKTQDRSFDWRVVFLSSVVTVVIILAVAAMTRS